MPDTLLERLPLPPEEVRKTMTRSLRGELTETSPEGQYALTDKSFITTVYRTLCKQGADGGGGGGLAGVDQKAGVKFVSDALSPTLACSAASMGAVDELAAMLDGGVSARRDSAETLFQEIERTAIARYPAMARILILAQALEIL